MSAIAFHTAERLGAFDLERLVKARADAVPPTDA